MKMTDGEDHRHHHSPAVRRAAPQVAASPKQETVEAASGSELSRAGVWAIWQQLRPLWVPILAGSFSMGLLLPNLAYMGVDFFAQRYTTLPPEDIHCDTNPGESYCKSAVTDNLAWQTGVGVVTSIVHATLGPLLGAMSDAKGRRPVLVLGNILKAPCIIALGMYAFFHLSLYPVLFLVPLAELPIFAVWFAYITDCLKNKEDSSVAFGQITSMVMLSVVIGAGIGTFFSLKTDVGLMILIDFCILFPYLLFVLPESLPVENRKPMDWSKALPWKGLSILVRDDVFARLSFMIIAHVFVDTGFRRVSTSYLQKYLIWPKTANSLSMALAGVSSIIWASSGLTLTTRRLGDTGALGVSLCSTALYMLAFAFVADPWQVYTLNLTLLGPAVMAFPATSAITSRLVGQEEQGYLQGALSTGKALAEAFGPVVFGGLFEITASESNSATMLSRVPILAGGVLTVLVYWVVSTIPRRRLEKDAGSKESSEPEEDDEETTPMGKARRDTGSHELQNFVEATSVGKIAEVNPEADAQKTVEEENDNCV